MRLVVVGAGIAGVSLIEKLKDSGFEITLIEKENPPFRKHLFIDWLLDKINNQNFFLPLESLKSNIPSLEIIQSRVLKVNLEKRKVFLKEYQSLEFDKIVFCCGLRGKRVVFPGVYKEGVYYLGEEALKLKQDLIIYGQIIVYAKTILGINLAKALHSLNKDVKIIVDSPSFSEELKQELISCLGEGNLYFNSQIAEGLGEGRIRAVKLSRGKFLACDLLIIDSGYFPYTSLLRDYPDLLSKEGFLKVDDYLKVNDTCFACGDMTNPKVLEQTFDNNKYLASEQAKVVADNLRGLRQTFSWAVRVGFIERRRQDA